MHRHGARIPWLSGVHREERRRFGALWTAFFAVGTAWGLTIPLFPVVMVESGLPIRTYGVVQSCAALAAITAQLFVGRLSDRLERRKPFLLAGLLAAMLAVAGIPYAASALAFATLMSFHAAAQSTYRAMNGAWVTQLAHPESVGRVHGLFRIAGSLGWIVATPLLGLIRARFGDGGPFLVAAAVNAVVAACVGLFIAEGTERGPAAVERRGAVRKTGAPATEAGGSAAAVSTVNAAPGAMRDLWRTLLPFFLALGFFHAAQGIGMNFNTIYLKEGLGLPDVTFGWMVSAQAWLEVPLMLALGALSDRLPARRVLSLAFAVSGLRWLLLSVVRPGPWLVPVQLLHAVGVTAGDVLAVAFVVRQVPRHLLATALGWKFAVQNGALLLAPAVGGYVAHMTSLVAAFRVAGVLALVAGGIMALYVGAEGGAREDRTMRRRPPHDGG